MTDEIKIPKITRRIKPAKTEEKVDPIPMRNKYIGGTCKTCKNDFIDLEGHYIKFPSHKK